MAFEAKDYPIYGVMFHPETANHHIVGKGDLMLAGKVNNEVNDEIAFRFSEFIHKKASESLDTNYFEDPEFGYRMEMLNTNLGLTFKPDNWLLSYGLDHEILQ